MIDKETLIAKVREVAERLGKTSLNKYEFQRATGIGDPAIYRQFESWSELCVKAGLAPLRTRHAVTDDELFEAMRRGFLAYGGVCARHRVAAHLPFPVGLIARRFVTWVDALDAFRRWLIASEAEFPYMAEIARWMARSRVPALSAPPSDPAIESPPSEPSDTPRNARTRRQGEGRTVGELLDFRGMVRAPVNEMGVVALFALCAKDLGFEIESIGRDFPDCLACRRIGPGKWQQVRIEFEFRSRNFLLHNHDLKGCDLIVCWENDWGDDCPIEVIALKQEIRRLREEATALPARRASPSTPPAASLRTCFDTPAPRGPAAMPSNQDARSSVVPSE